MTSDASSPTYGARLLSAAQDPAVGKADRTRMRLLASIAARLNQGERETDLRVTDVADDAGVAHGTFYRYFRDRSDAVDALANGFVEFLHDGLSNTQARDAASPDREEAATLAYVRLFRANTGLMRLMMSVDAAAGPWRARFHALNRIWNERIAASIANRTGATVAQTLPIAYALGGMVDEFLAQLYLRRDPALAYLTENEPAVAKLLAEVWRHGAEASVGGGR